MASAIKELRSLPLFELIGAPMVAIVQAQTQAARATVEFIEQVGFNPPDENAATSELDVGDLRMAEFRYRKADEQGNQNDFVARVPVLSLVPIPGIQVKNAKVAFTAKITDVVSEAAKTTQSKRAGSQPAYLKPALTNLRGTLAAGAKANGEKNAGRGNFEINIEIELEQMPLAPGMEKILNLLDQAINDQKKV